MMTARVAALQTSSGAWERGALRVAPNVERAVGCAGRFGAVRTFAAGYSRESTVRPRVNDEIVAKSVRLVRDGGDGEESSHEIVTVAEAIELARAAGLDLVEVNGKASPPVCRLMDYERMRYDQKKRAKEQKKAQVAAQKRDVTKELRLTAKIDTHDLNVKINGAKKFLDAGNRVTFRIMFKNSDGIAVDKRAARGTDIMNSVIELLDEIEVVRKPTMVGANHMTASVIRSRKKK